MLLEARPRRAPDKEIVASIAVDAAAYSVKDALEFCLQAASSNLGGSDEDDGDAKVASPPPTEVSGGVLSQSTA